MTTGRNGGKGSDGPTGLLPPPFPTTTGWGDTGRSVTPPFLTGIGLGIIGDEAGLTGVITTGGAVVTGPVFAGCKIGGADGTETGNESEVVTVTGTIPGP